MSGMDRETPMKYGKFGGRVPIMFFNERVETMSREEMKEVQLARLKMVMKRGRGWTPSA